MNTISLRLYPETEALYKRLLDECDAGTNGKPATADQFINYLLECAQNPRKIEVSKQTDLDRIKQLETELLNQGTTSGEFSARVTELEHHVFRAESELTILRDQAPASQLQETQIVFEVTEPELQVIDQIIYKYSKFQQISRADALYSLIRDHKLKR